MSDDLEAILKALAAEPPEYSPPPRIRKQGWHERLIFNTWTAPFPYLLHRWTIDHERDINLISGSKRKMSNWVKGWNDEEFAIWQHRGYPDYAYPEPYAAVPWLVRTNCDKAHRCPVCGVSGGLQDQMNETGGYIKGWHVYTCQTCGQRASKRFYLREHPCDQCPRFSHLRRMPRHVTRSINWFMTIHTPVFIRRPYVKTQSWCRDWWDWNVKGMRW